MLKMTARTSNGERTEWSFTKKSEAITVGNDETCTWYIRNSEVTGCFFSLEFNGEKLILRPKTEIRTSKKNLTKAVYVNQKSTVYVGSLGIKIELEDVLMPSEEESFDNEATRMADFAVGDDEATRMNDFSVGDDEATRLAAFAVGDDEATRMADFSRGDYEPSVILETLETRYNVPDQKNKPEPYALTPPVLPNAGANQQSSESGVLGDSTMIADAQDIYKIADEMRASTEEVSKQTKAKSAKKKAERRKRKSKPKRIDQSESLFTLPADSSKKAISVEELTVVPKRNRKRKLIMFALVVVSSIGAMSFLMKKRKKDAERQRIQAEAAAALVKTADDLPPAVNKPSPPIFVMQSASDPKAETQEKRATEHLIAGRLLDAERELKELALKYPKDARYQAALNLVKSKILERCSESLYATDPLCLGGKK